MKTNPAGQGHSQTAEHKGRDTSGQRNKEKYQGHSRPAGRRRGTSKHSRGKLASEGHSRPVQQRRSVKSAQKEGRWVMGTHSLCHGLVEGMRWEQIRIMKKACSPRSLTSCQAQTEVRSGQTKGGWELGDSQTVEGRGREGSGVEKKASGWWGTHILSNTEWERTQDSERKKESKGTHKL